MGVPEIEAFLTHLAVEGNVSGSTQNQALYRDVLKKELGWLDDVEARLIEHSQGNDVI